MSIIGAFMVPHPPMILKEVGKGSEKQITKTIKSYERVAEEIAKLNPETIIISSPHTKYYSDYFHICRGEQLEGDFGSFGAKMVKFTEENDIELIEEIERISKEKNFPAGRTEELTLDHGTMVPLYFIRKLLPKTKLIVVGLSSLPLPDNYEFGTIIKDAVNNLNRKVVFVASGDLSHKLQEYGPYGFIKEGPIYDEKIMNTMSNANFNELLEYDEDFLNKASECGHRSFTIMAGALDKIDIKATFLSHEDVTGVGYGICTFYPERDNPKRNFLDTYLETKKVKPSEDEYVKLALKSLTSYLTKNIQIAVPGDLPKEMTSEKSGVFVSIHKFGCLRGCIGTFLPTTNSIAEEIINNAIEASISDPRFPPITKEEIPYLEVNVDVLSTPEPTTKEDLDPKKYGVIVRQEFKRGLLLPDLEGIDTVDEQISIAKRKAGITNGEVELERFEVIRHK
jgi:AmmeMemoRadiSam system protein A/AmmeMemoRadiSam system protein B